VILRIDPRVHDKVRRPRVWILAADSLVCEQATGFHDYHGHHYTPMPTHHRL
jgi:hypothetical protein